MPVRHSRTLRPARSARRKLVWATSTATVAGVANLASVAVDLLAGFEVAGASKLGCTAIRTHGRIFTTSLGASTGFTLLGIKVSDKGEITTPIDISTNTNMYLDWALQDIIWPNFSGATADAGFRYDVDLRAKRKLEEMNQTWALHLTNDNAGVATYTYWFKTLIALP